ncbi:stretch-activated cation channel Mid1 [Irpex rosettiformis]|uniref:Stretch-activated cation channel Mid1 n=1 Tax=Irpex rosettiformis TaxID=378272 RepID=A0ACB8TXW8_9APHY|nr:stretch-activated cation channel Mid1 [Irpex rosettiformis]
MLLLALFLLLQSHVINAQQSLSFEKVFNFTAKSLPNPPIFSLPPARANVSISVALCASSPSLPQFFISNDTSITQPGQGDVGSGRVFEITLENGFGAWSGLVSDGGFLTISGAVQVPIEIGISEHGPLHEVLDGLPLLGDTTSNQALVFSHPISYSNTTQIEDPTYPNYVLPPANISFPSGAPALPIDVTLFVASTSSPELASLPHTGCAIRAANIKGSQLLATDQTPDNGLWLRDSEGWRWQWLFTGLTPLTNYTTYVVENGTKVSGPVNFVTKSASFSCHLVHSLPYCPSVNYAVPLNAPPSRIPSYTSLNLPSEITDPLLEVLTNFTISLSTQACGRDNYSPLVSCADCQRAYRAWLCSIWFTRCADAAPTSTSTSETAAATAKVTPATQVQLATETPRSPGLPPFPFDYTVLLPCLETCTAADRACPYFLGFKCPLPKFTAQQSYGVGYVDHGEEGTKGKGSTGVTQDRWGNVWCNGV